MTDRCTWRLITPVPTGSTGAIACLRLDGPIHTLPATLQVEPDRVALRSLLEIDEGLVARPASDTLLLFPHAGPAVVRSLVEALERLGCVHRERPPAGDEASVRDRVIERLPTVPSRLGIERLLAQPARWSAPGASADHRLTPALRWLLEMPTVAAIGPPNVGKSTLLNALAGQSVSIVADAPGTTRDHVGVRLDLAGFTVRYLDMPGLDAGATGVDQAAQSLAIEAASDADLLLCCEDVSASLDLGRLFPARDPSTVLRVGLRADLGSTGARLAVSLAPGGEASGLSDLIRAIRECLVPAWALASESPWRFWVADPD